MRKKYNLDVWFNFKINKFLSKKTIKSVIRDILWRHEVDIADLSVAVVTSAEMIEINKKYLNSETETDVIAFDFTDDGVKKKPQIHPLSEEYISDCKSQDYEPDVVDSQIIIKNTVDGEIIINGELAVRIASEFGFTPADELMLYIIHGLLHIIGYDDIKSKDKKIMLEFQYLYLCHFIDEHQDEHQIEK